MTVQCTRLCVRKRPSQKAISECMHVPSPFCLILISASLCMAVADQRREVSQRHLGAT